MTLRSSLLGLLFTLLAAPSAVDAQSAAVRPKVGFMSPASAVSGQDSINAFRAGLREHGYVDGANVMLEVRFADGYQRVPALLADLLTLKVDVLVAVTTPVAVAAKEATSTTPIVFAPVSDPVRSGLVKSLAQPGANVTGYTDTAADLAPKRLALLVEVVPRISRIGVLRHADNPGSRIASEELDLAARQLGLALHHIDVRDAGDLGPAFATLAKAQVRAIIALADAHLQKNAQEIAQLAIRQRLPLMGFSPAWTSAGALLSYGAAVGAGAQLVPMRQAASYVAKILRGARPADLPVQQPTKFELVINLRTAKTLGVTIPASVLALADQVVEK
jgi:putative ABC transport system substrate-binding protein